MRGRTIDVLPRVLPAGWSQIEERVDGRAYRHTHGLAVIASVQVERDGRRWLHVSASRRRRCPSYDDLAEVKRVFVGAERVAVQIFPKASEHVDLHPYCLHLWSCLDGDPFPDMRSPTTGLI